jgi:hypothetical protein
MKTLASCFGLVIGICVAGAEGQTHYWGNSAAVQARLREPVIYCHPPIYDWPARHPTTAAGAYLHGVAAVIQAQAQWNFWTSQAMINAELARQLAIENAPQQVEAYFKIRDINRKARENARRPRPAAPASIQTVKMNVPRREGTRFDAATGGLAWPRILKERTSVVQRNVVETAACRLAAEPISVENRVEAIQAVQILLEELRSHIREVPSGEYRAARRFLEELKRDIADEGRARNDS